MAELRVRQHVSQMSRVIGDRTNYTAHAHMSPNYCCIRMPRQKSFHLLQVNGLRTLLCKRNIHIAMYQDHQSDLAGEVENAVKRWVCEARCFARDLGGNKLFVDRELAYTRKYARECLEYTPNVIDSIHVGWVKSRDHGIESCSLLFRKRSVCHRNVSVRK